MVDYGFKKLFSAFSMSAVGKCNLNVQSTKYYMPLLTISIHLNTITVPLIDLAVL